MEANHYVTLGTVSASQVPWASPVYFSFAAERREFYWVSEVDAVHSRNLADNPRVSGVAFDSTVAPYRGRAVYVDGMACRSRTGTSH